MLFNMILAPILQNNPLRGHRRGNETISERGNVGKDTAGDIPSVRPHHSLRRSHDEN